MRARLTGLAAALLMMPAALTAQDPTLTLAEALDRARENNPAHRQARNDLLVAAAAERQSWGGFLPRLSLQMGLGGYHSTMVTGEDDFGKPRRLEDPLEFQGSSSQQGVSLALPLFEGGRRIAELSASRAEARAARAGVEAELARLDAELARSYYAAVRYNRQAALEESLLESAREHLEATQRLLAIAARDPLDLLGAEVEAARQERAAQEARGEAFKSVLRLRELMGEAGAGGYTLTDSLPAIFDPAGTDVDALVASAVEASPTLARLEARSVAADRRARAEAGGRFPSVQLSAGYSRSMSLDGYEALRELNPQNSNLSFALSFSIPVFSQFQTSYRVAQARAAREDADEDLRAARLLAEREVRSAVLDLGSAYQSAQLAERAAALAADRVSMAREKYALGTLSFAELRDAVDQGAAAEREAIAARFSFADALVTLREKAGTPLAELR